MYDKYALVEFPGERFGSSFSRLHPSAYVLAKWAGRYDGNVDLDAIDERLGMIGYFIRQSICYHGKIYLFFFSKVRWFQYHPERHHRGTDGVSPQVWCSNLFESLGTASFIPVQPMAGKFVAGFDKVGAENGLFVMPLERTFLV